MELQKYKICPECGEHNPPNLLECRYCEADLTGVKVVDDSVIELQQDAVDSKSDDPENTELVRICECGAENAPQARKCKVCGEDISDIIPVKVNRTENTVSAYELKSVDGSFSIIIDKPLITIGREAELSDYLESKVFVSRQHCKLTIAAGKVFVENLSRTNKTFLNNVEIQDGTPVEIKDGDILGLGGKEINGELQDDAAYFVYGENK
ncbi:MAG: FHA domain-containing protein [Oscillospiraceae bacterium]|nr:FHA domain-containing protein [Oscillospiraceae bacterium]